jgi:hypothetical protein
MTRGSIAAVVLVVLAGLGLSVDSSGQPVPPGPAYGYGVRVGPDDELADVTTCELSVFRLDDERRTHTLPALRIVAGDSNGLRFLGADGVDVRFECSIDRDRTAATYEIEGRLDGRLVLSHLGTIRVR